jgi:hypothetical protein
MVKAKEVPMQQVTSPVRVILAGAFVMTGAFAVARADQPPPHHAPPAEAIAACSNAKASDACSFTLGDHTITGTCEAPRDRTELACRPDHAQPHGPPPAALAACSSSKLGEACSVTFGDHTLAGTCEAGPSGDGPLACRPNDRP